MKRLLLLGALILSACASPTDSPPTDSGPDFVFITATPTLAVEASPTEELLPFRDLSSPTSTETAVPPTETLVPATATTVVIVATVVIPAIQPTTVGIQAAAQPTQAIATQPPAPATANPPPTAIPIAPISDVGSAEQAVIDLSNIYRTQYGLSPLSRDEGIMSIARARSSDMVARGFFGHNDPLTGASLAKPQILALGFGRAGENIYWSGRSLGEMAAQAVDWFMSDTPHRANILNTSYTVMGVGIAWNGQGWTLTQNFGGP